MSGNIDLTLADKYFQEASQIFRQDAAELWGVSLAGPLIFVDLETRAAVTNQPDGENKLKQHESIYIGTIPPQVMVANTAMTWAGVHWTMVLWQSLPKDQTHRAALIAHESFHRIQAEIGLPMKGSPTANAHLDTLVGRYWLQLEWRALAKALNPGGKNQIRAIGDALIFRAYRRSLSPDALSDERALEMNEGLAEYTGFKLSPLGPADVVENLQNAPERYPSFVRSFAYASGPAYGFLLDHFSPEWRIGLKLSHDLGAMLQVALGISLPDDLKAEAEKRALDYACQSLYEKEVELDIERQEKIAHYQTLLLDNSVLILPISPEVQCAFDPRTAIPIPGVGTVFPFIHISEKWGVLDVEKGGLLMHTNWEKAQIVAPDSLSTPLSGTGWQLDLLKGWQLEPGERSGDFKITKI